MTIIDQTPSSSSPWTFTQGLILGQVSFLVLVLLFVRYVVFSPSEQLDEEGFKGRRTERTKRAVLSTNALPPPPPSSLLAQTGYDMATHPAESTGWLNVLFSQVIQGYRNDLLSAGGEEGARRRVEKWLNPDGGGMSWLDPIHVTALSLGSAFPLLSHARIRPADGQGRIRAEIDVDYLDSVSLAISTAVLVNFPRPRFAVLPVSLGVELASLGGTVSIQIHDPVNQQQHLHACLLPDFHLNLKTTSLLGSRAKLQDIPKLEQLILSRLRAVIQDRLVYPNHLTITLPRVVSSSISPAPIINDIGESAVAAMGDAVKEGFNHMIEDLSGGVISQTDGESYMSQDQSTPSEQPAGLRIGQRKITMPAGFPHSAYASSSSNPSPGLPQPRRSVPPSQGPPPPLSATSSAHRVPQAIYGRTTSTAPSAGGQSQSQSNFRFRNQFSSQPGTPGPGIGTGGYEGEARRVGALNARAG